MNSSGSDSVTKFAIFLYSQYLSIPIYLIQGYKYFISYLEANKAKNEYEEKKAIMEKSKEAIIKTPWILQSI